MEGNRPHFPKEKNHFKEFSRGRVGGGSSGVFSCNNFSGSFFGAGSGCCCVFVIGGGSNHGSGQSVSCCCIVGVNCCSGGNYNEVSNSVGHGVGASSGGDVDHRFESHKRKKFAY